MPENLGTKACLVCDNGSFLELAVRLSKSFGKVYYFSSWKSAFPTSNSLLIGTGIEGVQRVDDFWYLIPEVDLIVFPDLYYPGLQNYLRQNVPTLRVWGGGWAEELELNRIGAKKLFKKLGIETPGYTSVTGLPALREYLKHHKRKWVKIPKTRGDMESFYSKDYPNVESVLDDLQHHLGAGGQVKEFLVEDDIPDSLDIAADFYTIDGQFPKVAQISHEVKDRAVIGSVLPESKWPEQIKDTNQKISDTLRQYGCRQYLAMETRVTKEGTGYVNDPCVRLSSPPGGLLLNQYTNTDEIIWEGAAGKCVDPGCAGRWGVSLVIYSEWAEKNWQEVRFPAKIRDNVKLKNFAIIDGKYQVIPQATGLVEIGEVVATSETIEAAIEECQSYAEQIEGHKVRTFRDTLKAAQEELDRLKEYGITL